MPLVQLPAMPASKAGAVLIWLCLSGLLALVAAHNYLLFHSLAEFFSIVIAAGIFMFAWAARQILPNHYLLFVGIAYLFVGGLDLLHTSAYKGMGLFAGYGANPATQLWIAARYLESLALLTAPFFLRRALRPALALCGFGLLFVLILGAIFFWNIFPESYIEGVGLTPFKIVSEYVISLLLLAAMFHLLYHRREFEKDVLRLLVASIVVTVASEITFTTYVSVYGWANFSGHILKIISFYLIYRAIIQTGLVRPYTLLFRELKQSQEALTREKQFAEKLIDTAQAIVLVLDREDRILQFNPYLEKIAGHPLAAMRNQDWFAQFIPAAEQPRLRHLFAAMRNGDGPASCIGSLTSAAGERLEIEWFNRPLMDEKGEVIGLLCVGHNMTERLQADRERDQLIIELQDAIQKIKTLSGLLPICASCKKIRDDKGYWNQIEVYIRDHSDADFTHGLCPDCAQKLYPGIYPKPQG